MPPYSLAGFTAALVAMASGGGGWPRLAASYVGANLVLDYLMLGVAMGWGLTFFKFASIWLAYGILAFVAWRTASDAL